MYNAKGLFATSPMLPFLLLKGRLNAKLYEL